MNILELAQRLESEHAVIVGRANISQPLSETNLPAVQQITPGDYKSVACNVLTFAFTAICQYGGGLQDTQDVYFQMRGHCVNANGNTTTTIDDPDSCLLMGQGLSSLANLDKMAQDAADAGVPAISTMEIAAVSVAVDRRVTAQPASPASKIG